jgi:hypothetical protein
MYSHYGGQVSSRRRAQMEMKVAGRETERQKQAR